MSQKTGEKSEKSFIVITGASSGIGEACACRFNKEGYPLLLLDCKKGELEKKFGKMDNVMISEIDVSKYEDMCRAFEKAEKSFGSCCCLINNAGLALLGKMEDQELEEWEKMMKVNVCGVLHGIRCVLKNMKENKCGTIINISAESIDECFENSTMFCATKAAVNAISEGVRKEAAMCGVKVTTISPGLVEVKQT
ncbi:short chain dehydrogenase [Reticulomyxa filosa]|uniref:Short chain dehydrogenase n=1 Tax=Reticulomyxa filosa TaxID=46433 RepID=X6P1Y0_RETFI|nr:short chain dehydrogenase [Reticulomyxa filosa]|eukprot:ETO32550.1 short chain dehydrogenase [Reticulomyxa filosa]